MLDTNSILRYLLRDIPEQAETVRDVIASDEGAETTPEVIAECVYVLGGVYELDRRQTAYTLTVLLREVSCEREPIVLRALDTYAASKLDFVDCILAATRELTGKAVITFDKELLQAMGA